jgi:hypothetical protein
MGWGDSGDVTKSHTFGSDDWELLEWGWNVSFCITVPEHIGIRKVTAWVGYSEQTGGRKCIGRFETWPWGGIQARGKRGEAISYTYSPG